MPNYFPASPNAAGILIAVLVFTSALPGCANSASPSAAPAGPPVLDKPAAAAADANAAPPVPSPISPVTANVAPAAPKADTSYLLGKKYSRAFVAPRVIAKDWSRAMNMEMDKELGLDFMLMKSKEQLLAIVGAKGRRLRGSSYEYTVQDQLLLPPAVRELPLARCTVGDDRRKSILAAVSLEQPQTVRWAAAVSDAGEIRVLSAAQHALLRCEEKARRIR